MHEAGPVVTILVGLLIVICCSVPIFFGYVLSDERYKEAKSEYRRSKEETNSEEQ